MNDLGALIRAAREARRPRVRQVDLARQLGISKDEMWNLENGRTEPSEPTLVQIAELLGITVEAMKAGVPEAKGASEVRVVAPEATRVVVITSRWNELVTRELRAGADEELRRAGVDVEHIEVPGAWEIPMAARAVLSRSANRPQAVVALGCILQGETPHAALLASEVGGALMRLQVETGVPISWGVLTPDSLEQALDRAGMKHGNKGREAAQTALEMVGVVADVSGG